MELPTDFEVYDNGDFNVFLTRWGTWAATTCDGKGLCSGLDKSAVIFWAREHLNGFQLSYASYPKESKVVEL
jgi:hypothetical protein